MVYFTEKEWYILRRKNGIFYGERMVYFMEREWNIVFGLNSKILGIRNFCF